jgi:hypothetical protein
MTHHASWQGELLFGCGGNAVSDALQRSVSNIGAVACYPPWDASRAEDENDEAVTPVGNHL